MVTGGPVNNVDPKDIYKWSRGIGGLQQDAEKLSKDLADLGGEMGATGPGQGIKTKDGITLDRFTVLTEKLKREIDQLLDKGIKRVSGLPQQTSYSKGQSDNEALWKNEFHGVSEQITSIISSFDTDVTGNKMEVIVRLLDLKDNIQN
jgi:hypothetical protein